MRPGTHQEGLTTAHGVHILVTAALVGIFLLVLKFLSEVGGAQVIDIENTGTVCNGLFGCGAPAGVGAVVGGLLFVVAIAAIVKLMEI